MRFTDVVVIGGGQSGLAMSRCLSRRGIEHLVIERGRVAGSWRRRWPSLRLLTPNWQTRLPDFAPPHEADRFMTRDELVQRLEDYAFAIDAPLLEHTHVWSVEQRDRWFVVRTNRGAWLTRSVVIASGYCAEPLVPALASELHPDVVQLTPDQYRGVQALPAGGVLVVGAAAAGTQLAYEIQSHGHQVTLAVGRHARMPRSYRGRDIMFWLDASGILRDRADRVRDLAASRGSPSLQLVGSDDGRSLDLGSLRGVGVELVGRALGVNGKHVRLAEDLGASIAASEVKLGRVLDRIDRFIESSPFAEAARPVQRPALIETPLAPREIDLERANIRTVIWATGYRRSYPWLRLPVVSPEGEIVQHLGVTSVAGLFVLGMNFQCRRNSAYIDGVGDDATELSELIWQRLNTPGMRLARTVAAR